MTILHTTRSALGLSSWQALADLLGRDWRTVQRWQSEGIPEKHERMVTLACKGLLAEQSGRDPD